MDAAHYEPLIPDTHPDVTYRLLTSEGIREESMGERTFLIVDPARLTDLAHAAFTDIAFHFRTKHIEQIAAILKHEDASENDRKVARALLRNAVVAAEHMLPSCQDTGTATIVAKKGEYVITDADDYAYLSEGVFRAYDEHALRYSQVAATSLFDETNTGTNLPAQIDIAWTKGNEYRALFIAKGGGSSNKTSLYQETKSVLNDAAFTTFIKNALRNIGVAACPPYHLVIVVGGTSPELTLKTVKLASAGYLDTLPTQGSGQGGAFRDLAWEERIYHLAKETGFGAQFGGAYFALDVRVIRLPRHAGSCPVGVGVSCSADRNVLGRITREGVFIETLERAPATLFSHSENEDESVAISLDVGMDALVDELSKHPVGTFLQLSGTLIVARDIAHARMNEMLQNGEGLPAYMKEHPVYYAGPAKTPFEMASGSFGPTTAQRMDVYVPSFMEAGGSRVMLAKGNRGDIVTHACKRHRGFYLGTVGGAAALVAKENILRSEVLDFDDLGMEAVRKIRVKDLLAVILVDDKGNSLYDGML